MCEDVNIFLIHTFLLKTYSNISIGRYVCGTEQVYIWKAIVRQLEIEVDYLLDISAHMATNDRRSMLNMCLW